MVTIAITPFSELKKDTILIGANCINDANIRQVSEENISVINPYANHDDILRSAEFCWNVSLDYCERLGGLLGKIHALSRSQRYWKTLLLPWMVTFAENLYDRYLRLSWVRNKYPNAVIEIPKLRDNNPFYEKSYDTWQRAYLHPLNIRIYSFLIECMLMHSNVKYLDIAFEDPPCPHTPLMFLKEKIKNFYQNVHFHSGDNIFLWRSERLKDVFDLSKKTGSIQWGTPFLKNDGFSKKFLDREKIEFSQTGDEFTDILSKIIKRALPVSLFEEFDERRKIASTFLNRKSIKKIFVSAEIWPGDTEKFLLAEFKEKGGEIIGLQHGGGYGNFVIALLEKVERSICDYFITWGWSDKDRCPTIPLPNPYLSGLANTHIKKNENILFIGSHAPMYMYRYQAYWIPEFAHSKYYYLKKVFFDSLNESVKKKILYRPYAHEYGWNEKNRIKDMLPDVHFFESGLAVKAMKACSLVVIDHPSTSFLEAFQVNVPTILFWDDTLCPMRKEAQPYFQLLRDVGILYYHPADAARKVNEIFRNPMTWWSSNKVQEARIKFCRRYAYARQDWLKLWEETVRRIENRSLIADYALSQTNDMVEHEKVRL